MRDLSRAQQRFLGLVGPRTRQDDQAQPLTHVTLSFQSRVFLTRQLYASGAYRGGPLFGFRSQGILSVQFVAPGGYPCGDPKLRQQPLALDERYVLGWSDCLGAVYEGKLDWVGNWVISPDSQVAGVEADYGWLAEGLETDLFNEEHILLTVGWDRGTLIAHTYSYDRGNQTAVVLANDFADD